MTEKSHSNWYRKGGISAIGGSNLKSGTTNGGMTKKPKK